MRQLVSSQLRLIFPLLAILAGCLLLVLDPLPIQSLRHAVFDQYQRWHPRVYEDVGVRIVDIDDESLRRFGQWPWPRDQVAKLVTQLRLAGADTVGFDILFSEPDRTSPAVLMQHWRLAPGAAAQIASLPDPDTAFAHALAAGKSVLGVAESATNATLPISDFGLIVRGPALEKWLPQLAGTISALPALATAATGNGAITFIPDADGVVRRVPMLMRADGQVLPSLDTEILRVADDARNLVVHTDDAGIRQIEIGKRQIPVSADGQFWVHFTRFARPRTVPAWRVMDGAVAAADGLQGSMVVIGTSAQGLQDLRFSPLGGVIPGVEVHAQALEQIQSGHWLQRTRWALSLEALVMLIGSVGVCILALRATAIVSALGTAVLLVLLNGAGWNAFVGHGLLLDAVMPSIGIVLTFIVASVARHMATEARQRWIQQAFASYVSPNRVAYLMAHPNELELGGRRQDCSFIFSDLTDFTGLVESSSPENVVNYLNEYLEGLIQIAFRHEGTLDRIVGDALAIMFSAPVPQSDHRQRALACALEMRQHAVQHAATLKARGISFGTTRIGVHCGEVVVGNFGGKTIFDYRAMGDAVNTAARLETLNRHLGTTMCVSQAIHDANTGIAMRLVGDVLLKGKGKPITVYEPLFVRDADYDVAQVMLANGHPDAAAAFERLHEQRPHDNLVQFQLNRLQAGESGNMIVMQEK